MHRCHDLEAINYRLCQGWKEQLGREAGDEWSAYTQAAAAATPHNQIGQWRWQVTRVTAENQFLKKEVAALRDGARQAHDDGYRRVTAANKQPASKFNQRDREAERLQAELAKLKAKVGK